jgi:hypothetical protein
MYLLAVVAETFPDKALVVFVLASPSTVAAGLLNDGSYLSY